MVAEVIAGLSALNSMKQFARFGMLLALMCMATGCRPEPELEVTITPSKVTIPDNSKRGTPLATVSVRWTDGAPFRGSVRLTKNQDEICQLAGMRLQLGRDTTKADDNRTSVCTVTAFKEGTGH
jgi:hypothetical protein